MFKKIKIQIPIWLVLSTAVFVAIILILIKFQDVILSNKELLNIFTSIFTILTFLGVILAYVDYIKRFNNAKNQTLIALKSQLDVISTWSGYEKGGYHYVDKTKLIMEAGSNWGNPFYQVFPTEITTLQTLYAMPGIVYLSKDIIDRIAQFTQELSNFLAVLDLINRFRFSEGGIFALKVTNYLNKATDVKTDKDDLVSFSNKLIELYLYLHLDMIGDDCNKRLYYKHRVLLDRVNQELERMDN